MFKAIAGVVSLFLLVAAIGGALFYAHEAGRDLGQAIVQMQWDADKLKRADALAAAIERNRKLEQEHAERVSEIRLSHQEFIHESENRAESAVRDVNLRNHRLRNAFQTCANTIDVLGDSEAAARADAEERDRLLGEVHEFHVSQYKQCDINTDQLNRLIDYQESINRGN